MIIQDLLSKEEIRKYHKEWYAFAEKYKPETPYKVHSGLPIIGQVFQYQNKPIFRSHIFKRKLKKAFDPYFTGREGYLHPYFHLSHYFFPIEQIAHVALSKIVPNYQYYIVTDRFDNKKPIVMKGKIDFKDTRASIEILPSVTRGKNKFVVRGSATFYEDRTNEPLQIWHLEGVGVLRKYVENIQRLKQGDSQAVEDLVREIEVIDIKHKKMINVRNYPEKDELIKKLREGKIFEKKLHDFFSYWEESSFH